MQCLVALGGDVGLDTFGVHDAAVGQHDGHLLGEERVLGVARLHLRLATFKRAYKGGGVLRSDSFVQGTLAVSVNRNAGEWGGLRVDGCRVGRFRARIDLNQRALAAQFHAADPAHFDFAFEAGFFDRLVEGLFDSFGVGGHATRGHAAADDIFLARRAFFFRNFDQVVNYHGRSILSHVPGSSPAFAAGSPRRHTPPLARCHRRRCNARSATRVDCPPWFPLP